MSEVLARLIEGCERITWRSWPGAPDLFVGVRTLSEPQWTSVVSEARARVTNTNERERSYLSNRAERRAIVMHCIIVRDGDEVRPAIEHEDIDRMDTETLNDLFRSIVNARDEAHGLAEWGGHGRVLDELDRVYARDTINGVAMRLRARFAGLCGFYGVTDARKLTDWQVMIYARLMREEDQ